MKSVAFFLCLLSLPFVFGADTAQLVQTNVNVQQQQQNNHELNNADKPQPDPESATASIAVQQEVLAVNQEAQPLPPQPNGVPLPPQPQQPVPVDPQSVQLLKEANAQYQYQINSRYEEKTRPVYGNEQVANSQYVLPVYPYGPLPGYPYYKENTQYQELGNGQRRADTTLLVNDGVKAQIENQDQSSYTHQRSQSYSEYGKGEASPDYNTYAYKRTYY